MGKPDRTGAGPPGLDQEWELGPRARHFLQGACIGSIARTSPGCAGAEAPQSQIHGYATIAMIHEHRSHHLGISNGVRQHAEQLLDQQMWCLGRDIRHPDGNALLRYGFQVWRPPANVVGSSAYTLALASGHQLTLWGFGLCFGHVAEGGLVYLGRFQFKPTWRPEVTLPCPVWDSTRLPRFQPPRTEDDWTRVRILTAGALNALGVYEEWALATLGRDYRHDCIQSWPKPKTAPQRIAASWRSLARRIQQSA